jgi:rhamnogalacturonyl hydrolase YesR
MDEPETGLETSGTAGLVAALKYGYQIGLLNVEAKKAADKATFELKNWLTPDGLLTGTAQVNKGGEALQRSGYRVISPYTLGFMGYLLIPYK